LSENAFLILSILSGAGAAAVLLYGIVGSKLRNVAYAGLTGASQQAIEPTRDGWRRSVLDRFTLSNRNMIQCPICQTIDFANIRFCCKCGAQMQAYSEFPTYGTQGIEAQYLTQDGLNRVVGLSVRVDPKTRIGIIVGVQSQEPYEQLQQTQI
jgi:hypothetical protein